MSLAYKISGFNRRRKMALFLKEIAPTPSQSILDVGFSEEEYSATDNYLEKNYFHPESITALSVDKADKFAKRYPSVKAVTYDGATFPFADNSFDVCWSNAVIEHVGSRERQIYFLKEINRTCKQAFVTTPNRFFPLEVHTRTPFLHWFLSKKMFDAFLTLIGKKWATGDYMNLLSLEELKKILAASGIVDYKIIKNRLLFFTLDFVVVWKK